jgi:pimeloyl-ACP methyl ester carboxylesterase
MIEQATSIYRNARTAPSLRYRLYQKSGHHPSYEQPDEFTTDLVEWARSL